MKWHCSNFEIQSLHRQFLNETPCTHKHRPAVSTLSLASLLLMGIPWDTSDRGIGSTKIFVQRESSLKTVVRSDIYFHLLFNIFLVKQQKPHLTFITTLRLSSDLGWRWTNVPKCRATVILISSPWAKNKSHEYSKRAKDSLCFQTKAFGRDYPG